MLNVLRPVIARLLTPVGEMLARTPVTPNAITITGTTGVVAGALWLFPTGHLFAGTMVCTGFVLADMLDGVLARVKGTSGAWGAFLDSTLDRIADAAVFAGLAVWLARAGQGILAGVALFCLVAGSLVSYAKARAEGLGARCDVGIAERTERLLIALVSAGLTGLGVPFVLAVGLWALAGLSAFTFGQRVLAVREAVGTASPPGPPGKGGDQGGPGGLGRPWGSRSAGGAGRRRGPAVRRPAGEPASGERAVGERASRGRGTAGTAGREAGVKSLASRAKDRLADSAYGLGWSLVCRVPEPWARWAFLQAGDIAWRRQGPGVARLEANLRRVIGPEASGKRLRALSRAAMRSYARYWLEVFRMPVIGRERVLADMRCTGEEEAAFANLNAGRGVIFALPHMGNWEHAGAWIIARGAEGFTTVQERLKPESVYERFVAFRESLGMEVLPATGGDSRFGILAQRLRAGGLVCLLADRDVTGTGIEVEFFGEKARMMGGSAALAVQTGAALMPVTLWYEGPYWGAHIHEEIPVPASGSKRDKIAVMTQQLAGVFEAAVAAHPEDWHMLQRVFAADLDPERLAAAQARAGAGSPWNGENGAGGPANGGGMRGNDIDGGGGGT